MPSKNYKRVRCVRVERKSSFFPFVSCSNTSNTTSKIFTLLPYQSPHLYRRELAFTKHNYEHTLPTRLLHNNQTHPVHASLLAYSCFPPPFNYHPSQTSSSQCLPTPQRSTTLAPCQCPFPAERDSTQATITQKAPILSRRQKSTPR